MLGAFDHVHMLICALEILNIIYYYYYYRIPFLLALRLSVRRFQMPLEGLSFVKTLVTFGIIYATDPLLQNMTKIVCLR